MHYVACRSFSGRSQFDDLALPLGLGPFGNYKGEPKFHPLATHDLGFASFSPAKLLRFAGIRGETSRKITFFVRAKFVSLYRDGPSRLQKSIFSRVRSLTALFHCLIRKIHTLYIARVVTLLCREIGIFASVPEKSRKKLIEKMRNYYSR